MLEGGKEERNSRKLLNKKAREKTRPSRDRRKKKRGYEEQAFQS